MNKIEKLQGELIKVIPQLKEAINYKLKGVTPYYGEDFYDERFLGNDQETQDCTKDFQYIANVAIAEATRDLGINLEQKEVDGADWVYDNDTLVEQKIRSFLLRSEKIDQHIKEYGLACQSWTGNKSSVYNSSKTDIHLLWSFGIEKSQISKIGCVLVSLKENETAWTTGKGKNDSYATLKLNNSPEGIYLVAGEMYSKPKMKYNYLILE